MQIYHLKNRLVNHHRDMAPAQSIVRCLRRDALRPPEKEGYEEEEEEGEGEALHPSEHEEEGEEDSR